MQGRMLSFFVALARYARVSLTVCAFALLPTAVAAQATTDGDWKIEAVLGAPVITIRGKLISGTTGCRPFSAEMTGDMARGRIRIAPLVGECNQNQAQVERQLLSRLSATQSFAIVSNRLEARNLRGDIQFRATRVTQVSTPNAAARTMNGRWRIRVVSSIGTMLPSGNSPILNISGSRFSVMGLCNDFSGQIGRASTSASSGAVSILIAARTERMCANPSSEAVDEALTTAHEGTTSYAFNGQELRFLDVAGNILLVVSVL